MHKLAAVCIHLLYGQGAHCHPGGWLTFHVEALLHEQLVVAGLVEEGGEPCLVPDAGVLLAPPQLGRPADRRVAEASAAFLGSSP